MTKDLESMKESGLSNLVFLEVNVGIPRGDVDFLSENWQNLFAHAVKECERLGIEMTLGIGPGWTGSGGPWVTAGQSMQHLVSSTVVVDHADPKPIKLPVPKPMRPYFGENSFTPVLKDQWNEFYKDVAVLAYPTPVEGKQIDDVQEKALYYRAPYSSAPGVKQFLPSVASYIEIPKDQTIDQSKIIDLTDKLKPDGTLEWTVPEGKWTIVRFGARNNGAITRPAPYPGLGFEADKFDTTAFNVHLDRYIGSLLKKIKQNRSNTTGAASTAGGLKRLHMDSWEMGAQNWTADFKRQFQLRRGYDPLPYYPVYAGHVVGSVEISERFLWDLRQTSQELVLENHAGHVKRYAHRNGMSLSIEPYDMNPTADLELGSVADVPMAEFWSIGLGFNASFSCIEATSIAHVDGRSLVPAEAFTAQNNEGWKQYPGSMKNQGDWAFATGINRFVYHTFQNQTLADSLKPGMTMGEYGVHWDRSQTWWPMVGDYHKYISRCQYILQQGTAVADILYLSPEGSPHVFRPPFSALSGDAFIPDRKGYNFDGCAPGQLYKARVKDGKIVFPGGASYRIMVLPELQTMTPALLEKIRSLVREGAVIVGIPPLKSPGLAGYPNCDDQVHSLSKMLWGSLETPDQQTEHPYGKGKVIWGGSLYRKTDNLYPAYELTSALLKSLGVAEDFNAEGPIRYTHRMVKGRDIYFVSNKTDQQVTHDALFRNLNGTTPELWDPITGTSRPLPDFSSSANQTKVPLQFDAYQSYFVVFSKNNAVAKAANFDELQTVSTLEGSWNVSFNPQWGGPEKINFDQLYDWTKRKEAGIKYYSGIAVYRKSFDFQTAQNSKKHVYLDLGTVKHLARVKLNGKDLGVVWTAPWRVDITDAVIQGNNQLEIEVANLWPNRLIGDEHLPDDGIKNGRWPDWLKKGLPRTSGRFAFTTYRHYSKDSPLITSGLLGPVKILQ